MRSKKPRLRAASAWAAVCCFFCGRGPEGLKPGDFAGGLEMSCCRRIARLMTCPPLPDLSVRPVDAAPRTELAQLQPIGVVPPVLLRGIGALLALGAGERDDLPVFLLRHWSSTACGQCGYARRPAQTVYRGAGRAVAFASTRESSSPRLRRRCGRPHG